jgi:hypothetical protein
MNKHKTNYHDASRWERGTQVDFKARDARHARNGARRANTPAVQLLTISNVSRDVLNAIDELAASQDRSRSSFIRRELRRAVAEYQARAV